MNKTTVYECEFGDLLLICIEFFISFVCSKVNKVSFNVTSK